MKTMVNDYCYRENHYSIVYDGKFYMSVHHDLIDENGRTIRELNFKDLHPGKTIAECLDFLKNDIDMEYYTKKCGMSRSEAYAKVFSIPLETAEYICDGLEKLKQAK